MALLYLARWSVAVGDLTAAQRYQIRADVIGHEATALVVVQGDRVVKAREAGGSGHAAGYPWMVYRRDGPTILTPPDHAVVLSG
jgi:hypothetical protein